MPCHNTSGRGVEVLTATPKTDGTAVKARRRRFNSPIVVRNRLIRLIPSHFRLPQSKQRLVSDSQIFIQRQLSGWKMLARPFATGYDQQPTVETKLRGLCGEANAGA